MAGGDLLNGTAIDSMKTIPCIRNKIASLILIFEVQKLSHAGHICECGRFCHIFSD